MCAHTSICQGYYKYAGLLHSMPHPLRPPWRVQHMPVYMCVKQYAFSNYLDEAQPLAAGCNNASYRALYCVLCLTACNVRMNKASAARGTGPAAYPQPTLPASRSEPQAHMAPGPLTHVSPNTTGWPPARCNGCHSHTGCGPRSLASC